MIRNRKVLRITAFFLLFQFLSQLFVPTIGYALTSGPTQPEFSSFEPVSTTRMVDEFTGDFTYNLPLLEVPGPDGSSYPVTLSYHSGVSPEDEASWVGLGWTLNSGAINRNTRGLPDDFKGRPVTYHNKMPANWTATTGGSFVCCEAFSLDIKLGINASLRYNNYRGFGYNAGAGLHLGKGVVALGYNVSDGQGSFSLNVDPTAILSRAMENHTEALEEDAILAAEDRDLDKALARLEEASRVERVNKLKGSGAGSIGLAGSTYGIFSYNESAKPTTIGSYSGSSFNIAFGFQANIVPIPFGVTTNVFASYTTQTNTPLESPAAFGYLYSGDVASNEDVMDYHVEKETTFNKRDVFLGLPFNDADNFIVSGEGIGGGFRLHNKTAGHFGPRNVRSDVAIFSLGFDVDAGWTFGAGADVGVGGQFVQVTNWNKGMSSFKSPTAIDTDEPVFFRFNNDLGGEWGSNHDDKPVQASINSTFTGKEPVVASNNFSYNNNERSGRSSYVAYNTNKDMLKIGTNIPSFKSFNKNSYVNTMAGRSSSPNEAINDLIGEIAIINEAGNKYLYSLPVYNQNESSLSFSVENASPVTDIEHGHIVYNTADDKVKVGYEQLEKYASTYLLTEINTPDFIDKTNDGGTVDDLGGYTRFNYNKLSGWYKWRAPFRGLIYNKNSHSDPKDDLGTLSEGEKEILYLQSIETKTHAAVFVVSNRNDALEASLTPLSKQGTPGPIRLKKLDKIELYKIEDCTRNGDGNLQPIGGKKPIKTVHFKYSDESNPAAERLSKGQPNATDSTTGKLTLKKVYFEYNGIVSAKISPYLFTYSYPDANTYFALYPAKYRSGVDDVTVNYKDLTNQNPDYSEFSADAWGNYQPNGQSRFAAMQSWIDQSMDPNVDFDPAAWHLKGIRLPSGGHLQIQYEQDDYAYVQDQEAHVMAPLLTTSSSSNGFFINSAAIGITDLAGKQRLVDNILKRYKTNSNKIYFKFLYSLIGNSTPNLETCNADFIPGYASVLNCSLSNGEVYVELSGRLPQEVCKEFVKTQRLGLLDAQGNCAPGMNESTNGNTKQKAIATVRQLESMTEGVFVPSSLCQQISAENSYLRVPTPIAKQGGGVRVKRLLMFDAATGLNSGAVLYGNEYIYQTLEAGRVISSGVATNEPQTIREENVLVDFVARKGQSLFSKIIAGKDLKQAEGPLGESILPGASVGYSKVIVRNIHSGKTNPGFSISEFFTAKDFPISLAHPNKPGTMTGINSPTPQKRFLFGILLNIFVDKTWATQGFSFVLNNMHGQLKSSSTYSGPSSDVIALEKSTLISRIAHEYYKPGEKVPVVSSMFGEVTLTNPGREVDLTFAQKKVEEKSIDVNVEGDIEFSFIPPFFTMFYPTAMPAASFSEGALYTHATSKVVRYPAIVKKTTVYQDGILHTEENIAFDQWTGKPVAVKSLDEFKGAYLAASIPASWEYPNYSAKYKTEGLSLKPSSTPFTYSAAPIPQLSFSNDGCEILSKIVTGDVLELGADALFHVGRIDYTRDLVELSPVSGYNGTPPSSVSEVKIVRSGRTNELSESAGDITFHNTNADLVHAGTMRQPDAQRYISSGTNANDGSLFISHLNAAFANPALLPLAGPYYRMNLTQYINELPAGCDADLSDATVRNVNLQFKTNGSTIKLELGTFEILCGSTYQLVKTPN